MLREEQKKRRRAYQKMKSKREYKKSKLKKKKLKVMTSIRRKTLMVLQFIMKKLFSSILLRSCTIQTKELFILRKKTMTSVLRNAIKQSKYLKRDIMTMLSLQRQWAEKPMHYYSQDSLKSLLNYTKMLYLKIMIHLLETNSKKLKKLKRRKKPEDT